MAVKKNKVFKLINLIAGFSILMLGRTASTLAQQLPIDAI